MRRLNLVLLLLFAAVSSYAAQPAEGRWNGAIALPAGPLEVEVQFEYRNNRWHGTVSIPSQMAEDLPLENIDITNAGKATFQIAHIPGGARFDGTVSGDTIEGKFTQIDQSYPFKLTRAMTRGAKENAGTPTP
ncbi:MAG TPA: hypothetical protein VF911_03320 [Thermoanaerobaculia bacterium]